MRALRQVCTEFGESLSQTIGVDAVCVATLCGCVSSCYAGGFAHGEADRHDADAALNGFFGGYAASSDQHVTKIGGHKAAVGQTV